MIHLTVVALLGFEKYWVVEVYVIELYDFAELDQLLEEKNLVCYLLEDYLIYHPTNSGALLVGQML